MSDISTGDEAPPRGNAAFPPRGAIMASKDAINGKSVVSNPNANQLDVSVIDLASDTESE